MQFLLLFTLTVSIFGMITAVGLPEVLANSILKFFQFPKKDVRIPAGIEVHNRNKTTIPPSFQKGIDQFTVVIPVRNGANLIQLTVESVIQSLTQAIENRFLSEATIIVIDDHSTDHLKEQWESLTKSFSLNSNASKQVRLKLVQNESNPGKWSTLRFVNRMVTSRFVAFVDVGMEWNKRFASQLMSTIKENPNAIGIAPSYSPKKPSKYWAFESFLKKTENSFGGPVTVHGATVVYDSHLLEESFITLRGQVFLNDDVLLPLILRSLYPTRPLVYMRSNPNDWFVRDTDAEHSTSKEFRRRNRMAEGNLEVLEFFFSNLSSIPPLVQFVYLRRISRIFWAVWVLLAVVSIGFLVTETQEWMLSAMLATGLLALYSRSVQKVLAAFQASLMAPLKLVHRRVYGTKRGVKWA